MKLIGRVWNPCLNKYEHTWLADNESDVTANFDPDCAEGSMILVISSGCTYMKNTCCQWQKMGTTEVLK